MTTDEYIIVIELGSSKVTGIGGKKLPDGSIHIEAVTQEPSSTFIRKGIIYNMDKSTQCLRDIIDHLSEQLKRNITQVYVGFGGQSTHSSLNSITKRFENEETISTTTIEELMSENSKTSQGNEDLLDVIPLEYEIGTQKQNDPIGVLSDNLTGNFLNILARTSLRANILNCFKKVGIHVVESKLHPLTLADEVLTESQKRSGCILVDFGSDTTTVSIYKNNRLRYINTIPLGSSNITKDIMSFNLEEVDAEELKITYGSIYENLSETEEAVCLYTLPNGTSITRAMLGEVINARMTEILTNVKWMINDSKIDKSTLVGGIWLTGGGANLKNLEKAFCDIVLVKDVHLVKKTNTTVHFPKNLMKYNDGRLLEAISIMAKSSQICTTELQPEVPATDIFDEPHPTDIIEEKKPEDPKPIEEVKEKKKEGGKFMKSMVEKLKHFSTMIVGEEDE